MKLFTKVVLLLFVCLVSLPENALAHRDGHHHPGTHGRPATTNPATTKPASQPATTTAAAVATPDPMDVRPTTGTLRIVVKWGIESAVDNYGYNVYRCEDIEAEEPDWKKLNKRMLPGVGNTSIPTVFRYADMNLGYDPDKIWYYKVEEISLDGKRVFFSHPVTGESPMIIAGKPKIMNPREHKKYGEEPFHKTENPRLVKPAEKK